MFNMGSMLLVFLMVGVMMNDGSYATPFSMYVWATGWDPNIGCSAEEFLEWDTSSQCFTPVYDTPVHRQWLWTTCNQPGKEIDTMYLYTEPSILQPHNCHDPEVQLLLNTLTEGHNTVSNLKIYALFSDGGSDIPEKDHIRDVVWFNAECANSGAELFDGVAVNNEDYDKTWSEAEMVTFLDNLNQIRIEADKQLPPGSLRTHFSVGWHWGLADGDETINVNWSGKNQNIMHHFIDIFHTLDVQTAFVVADAIGDRMLIAGFDYALAEGKQLYNTVYLNKAFPCQTTFFQFPPDSPDCPSWSHSFEGEIAMLTQSEELMASLPGVLVCLHYFRGPYSSGGHPDWPQYS